MACDPLYNNVAILLHCDGTNGSTAFPDTSVNNWSVAAGGVSQVGTTIYSTPLFGTGSAQFVNPGGISSVGALGVVFGAGSALDLSSGPFTVEFGLYLKPDSFNGNCIFSIGPSALVWFAMSTSGGPSVGASFYNTLTSSYDSMTTAWLALENTWAQVAFCYDGAIMYLFVNGILEATLASTLPLGVSASGDLVIGAGFFSNQFTIDGNIDEFRITKGVCRYTTNYTPATSAFGDMVCPSIVPNVIGLLDAAAQAAIIAAGFVVGTITSVGNVAPVGTVLAQSPLGGTSALPGSSVNLTESTGVPPAPGGPNPYMAGFGGDKWGKCGGSFQAVGGTYGFLLPDRGAISAAATVFGSGPYGIAEPLLKALSYGSQPDNAVLTLNKSVLAALSNTSLSAGMNTAASSVPTTPQMG